MRIEGEGEEENAHRRRRRCMCRRRRIRKRWILHIEGEEGDISYMQGRRCIIQRFLKTWDLEDDLGTLNKHFRTNNESFNWKKYLNNYFDAYWILLNPLTEA